MLDEIAPLPEDPEELRAFTARLLAEVKAQAILIEKLRHQLAGHRAHRFGTSSETAEQLQLALETSEIAAAAMTARLRLPDIEEKDRPKGRPIPDHVPRMEVELSPAADACADCGGKLRRIGENVTEELEYVPGRFIVNRIVRPRLTCSGCERFVQAPLPSRPIERGRPGPGLLAHVLVSKYADHLPLYRQSQIFERDGLDLDRSTLADWVGKSTALLEPLAEAIGRHVLAAEAIFADDTPIRLLAPGTGKTQTARLWTYARDERPWGGSAAPAAWYRFSGDRKGQHPKDHLARFRGARTCRRLRGVRRPLPLRRDPRSRLHGPCPAQVRRHGYRRITAMLRAAGWAVNVKRVERIWRQEGLKVPGKQPKKGQLWLADGSCARLRPKRPNHVWSYDFVEDRTHNGRKFRMLNVIDEFTRECLAIRIDRRLKSTDVIDVLSDLFILRGVPGHVRSDNGPEFIARAVREWIAAVGARTAFIEPGSPWENGYCESFNSKLRTSC